jgi:hypothetical protein
MKIWKKKIIIITSHPIPESATPQRKKYIFLRKKIVISTNWEKPTTEFKLKLAWEVEKIESLGKLKKSKKWVLKLKCEGWREMESEEWE